MNKDFIDEFLPKKEPKKDLIAAPEKTDVIPPAIDKVNDVVTDQVEQDIKTVIERMELANTDITFNYADWLRAGLSIANHFGEVGRKYFHRVSSICPKYTNSECDKEYDICLKENGKGVTIKSFFYLAEQAGIDIVCKDSTPAVSNSVPSSKPPVVEMPVLEPNVGIGESDPLIFNTPQLPAVVYDNLPEILQESCELFHDGIEKDIFLMSTITVLSGCFPHIEGIYFNRPLTAHLYLFITGPSASGKGTMIWSKYFAQAIHDYLTEQSARARETYEMEMTLYENLNKTQKQSEPRPTEPMRKMFYIPANSSSAAFTQALSENNTSLVLFETEADTLANTHKQDWGDSSDILRKAFHHEIVSLSRKTNKEFIEIKDPHIAIAVSGTPKQVHHLMPEVENGLFSRFMFYAFVDEREFINPFVSYHKVNYHDFFTQKGFAIFKLNKQLQKRSSPIVFQLTEEQGLRFTLHFNQLLTKSKLLLSRDLDASIKRLGIITFRIAMVLTALRILEDGEFPDTMICSEIDFETALTIATTLEKHAVSVYQNMPNNSLKGIRLAFFDKLPQKFDRQGYLKVAEELGINIKTAEKYIHLFQPKLLDHTHNEYTKIAK